MKRGKITDYSLIRYKLLFSFNFFIFIYSCSSQPMQSSMKEIDAILNNEVKKNKTPSVQYILFNKDSIIHNLSTGYADIINQRNVDENTTYNLFSITKTFTALAILQLAEDHKLDINQPVKKYLSEFLYDTTITIKQLLTHSAGIPNPLPLNWIHLTDEYNSFNSNTFFNDIFKCNNKIKSEPNEKYSYSNLGYVLLGQLIEKVSGITYEEYITENILKKLNLKPDELGFIITDSLLHAKGYHKYASFSNIILGLLIKKSKYMTLKEGNWKPFKNIYVNGPSYGGLIGTPVSLVKYIQDLLKNNSVLLSKEYKDLLFTENYTNNNKATGVCLSWFKGQLNGKRYFAHAGGGGGYYCEIRIYPEEGVGSVIIFNRSGMSYKCFLDKVDDYFFSGR